MTRNARWRTLRFIGLVSGWVAVVCALTVVLAGILFLPTPDGSDFGIYLAAAQALRHNSHAAIYTITTIGRTYSAYGGCRPLSGWGYNYQPLFAVLLEPLTLLSCAQAKLIWLLFNVGLWLACFAMLASDVSRHTRISRRWSMLLVALLMVYSLPIAHGIQQGQVHLVLLALFVGSFLLVERGHDYSAGALLAFGVFLKYLPLVIIGYYLLRGRWRVAAGSLVAGIALFLLELLLVGPQLVLASPEGALTGLANANANAYSVSAIAPMAALGGKVALLVFALAIVLIAHRVGLAKRLSWRAERLAETWALATMLIASPLILRHYLTWLIPGFIVAVYACIELPLGWRWRAAVLVTLLIAYALTETASLQFGIVAVYLLWLVTGGLFLYTAGVSRLSPRAPQLTLQVQQRA